MTDRPAPQRGAPPDGDGRAPLTPEQTRALLERAHAALRRGGRLLLDFDCPLDVAKWTPANCEWVCFEGTDD